MVKLKIILWSVCFASMFFSVLMLKVREKLKHVPLYELMNISFWDPGLFYTPHKLMPVSHKGQDEFIFVTTIVYLVTVSSYGLVWG